MKPQNIPEFKALIERYETITLEEIEKAWRKLGYNPRTYLTGMGSFIHCILCVSVGTNLDENNCHLCVYGEGFGCMKGILESSYDKCANASTPKKLFSAYRKRAKAMRQFAKTKNIEI